MEESNINWECYSCAKTEPQCTVIIRGYDDFIPIGSDIFPMVSADSVIYDVKIRNNDIIFFKYPIHGCLK